MTLLLNESFAGSDVTSQPWLYGVSGGSTDPYLTARTGAASPNGIPGSAVALDAPGSGALRLTEAEPGQATFVIYNQALSANAGFSVSFDFAAYGGDGGDGVSFFFLDGAITPTAAGAFGGSLGYAQKVNTGIAGLAGGYLGIGFDEFGNFSDSEAGEKPTGAGQNPDAITLRGSQATGYQFLTTTGSLSGGIDSPATNRTAAQHKTQIDLTPAGLLTIQFDLNGDGVFSASEAVINSYDVAATNGALPASLKFGFAGSTGGVKNTHDISNLSVSTYTEAPITAAISASLSASSSLNLTGLGATDSDGTIASFTITALPNAAQGTLFLGNPAAGGIAITAGQVLSPAQISQLFFQAAAGFTGASFSYTATDNLGAVDNTPAVITLLQSPVPAPAPAPVPAPVPVPAPAPVSAPTPASNLPPILPNPTLTIGGGSSNLTGLTGRDPDGSITSYTIVNLPAALQGQLFLGNPAQGGQPLVAGQRLTATQINQIFFRPTASFSKASFTYAAIDDQGATSNPATVNLEASPPLGTTSGTCRPGLTIQGTNGKNQLNGTGGADQIRGLKGNDRLHGWGCNDTIKGNRGRDQIFGDDGQDRLMGGLNADRLYGNSGRDELMGGRGIDRLRGGKGDDRLYGQQQADRLSGGQDNDQIWGGLGRDWLRGGSGQDRLTGNRGRDLLVGGTGNDRLSGNRGKDRLKGGQGRDRLNGGINADRLNGSSGSDWLRGGRGRDQLWGRQGNDRLYGGFGHDRLWGYKGNDTLRGGTESDLLTGGAGRDRFIYQELTEGRDRITDFNPAQDLIDIRGLVSDGESGWKTHITLASSSRGTLVQFQNGSGLTDLATLQNVAAADLGQRNFLL